MQSSKRATAISPPLNFLLKPGKQTKAQAPATPSRDGASHPVPDDGDGPSRQKKSQQEPACQGWRLMKMPAVKVATTKSRSTIYAEVAAGRFPKPIKIGPRSIAWREDVIRAHLDALERGETPSYPAAG